MTLAELTELMSKVSRKHPELVQDRNVALFIEACIEEAKAGDPKSTKAASLSSRMPDTAGWDRASGSGN